MKEDLTRREEYSQPQGMQSAEIIIDDRGNITMTGFIEDETNGLK